jgi:hypothetical protein
MGRLLNKNKTMGNVQKYNILNKYTLTCWVYNARQITSRRIAYSEFIPHSLLQSLNSQSHNYCHRQYHNYCSCSHCHSLDTAKLVAAGLLDSHLLVAD